MTQVTARFTFRGESFSNIPVLNPGACGGRTWLLVLDTSHTPDLFIVEATSVGAAIDVLADDEEHGDAVRVQEHERGDYGFRVPAGTVVLGVPLEQPATVNLRGEVVPEDEADYVREPSVSGSGIHYDSESVLVYGDETATVPFPVTYHGEGLGEEGDGTPASTTCSWCHAANPIADRFCGECDHEAHVPRMHCRCEQCSRRATGQATGPTLISDDVEAAISELRKRRRSVTVD